MRRGSVGSASACCKAGPSSILSSAPQGGSPTEQTSDEEMERGLSEWRRINVLYECMYVCYKIWKIKTKRVASCHQTLKKKKKKCKILHFKGSECTWNAKNPIFVAIIFYCEYKYCLEAEKFLRA